jgi:hypothetical protein
MKCRLAALQLRLKRFLFPNIQPPPNPNPGTLELIHILGVEGLRGRGVAEPGEKESFEATMSRYHGWDREELRVVGEKSDEAPAAAT